jgi:hypothetical protein
MLVSERPFIYVRIIFVNKFQAGELVSVKTHERRDGKILRSTVVRITKVQKTRK